MYEPKYCPEMKDLSPSISDIRFGIKPCNKFLKHDDPDAEPLHAHRYLEIFYNVSSDVSFLVNNNLYPVIEGSAILSRADDIHMAIFNKTGVHEYICLWIDVCLDSPAFSFLKKEDFCPLFAFDVETSRAMRSLLFSLARLDGEGGGELERAATVLQILTLFAKSEAQTSGKPYIPDALQHILDDIHENYSTIRNVNDILNTHFISSATLTRWFRKYIHSTPREYLESVRLSHAATMLAQGASVTDACMGTGFSDCSHFIVLFKRKFGETPYQYKKRNTK